MNSIHLDKTNFRDQVTLSEQPVLVDFYADWCAPCRSLAPVIEELAEEYQGKAKICKVNIDQARDLAAQFHVMSIPTIILFNNGHQEVDRMLGPVPKEHITKALDKYTAK